MLLTNWCNIFQRTFGKFWNIIDYSVSTRENCHIWHIFSIFWFFENCIFFEIVFSFENHLIWRIFCNFLIFFENCIFFWKIAKNESNMIVLKKKYNFQKNRKIAKNSVKYDSYQKKYNFHKCHIWLIFFNFLNFCENCIFFWELSYLTCGQKYAFCFLKSIILIWSSNHKF